MPETTAKRVSMKIPKGQEKKLDDAVSLVREQYGKIIESWRELTEKQRAEVLAHSPVFARLVKGLV